MDYSRVGEEDCCLQSKSIFRCWCDFISFQRFKVFSSHSFLPLAFTTPHRPALLEMKMTLPVCLETISGRNALSKRVKKTFLIQNCSPCDMESSPNIDSHTLLPLTNVSLNKCVQRRNIGCIVDYHLDTICILGLDILKNNFLHLLT